MAAAGCGDDGGATGQQQGVIFRDASGAVVCDSATDTAAPVLTAKAPLKLWSPNHKFHTIKVEDCFSVADACQPNVKAEFVWASSDEPVDSIGDGHHAPDIQVSSCGAIALRAERQGPKEGRVYKLGVRAVDAAGNIAESVCSVIVDHDQRGVTGADSGESYRVTFNGQNGQPVCDGDNPPPPSNPPANPPGNPPSDPPPSNPPGNPPPSDPPPSDPPPSEPPPSEPPPSEPPVNTPPGDSPPLW
jgi:hypothetical protein